MLQIRRDKGVNLVIISHITCENICLDPSLEWSAREGANEGQQHLFSLRNKTISELLRNPPLI